MRKRESEAERKEKEIVKSVLLETLIGFLVLVTIIGSDDDVNQEVINTRQRIVLFRVLAHFYLLMTSFQMYLCYFAINVCNIWGNLKRRTARVFSVSERNLKTGRRRTHHFLFIVCENP